MKISIFSPGCRLNQAEIESITTSLLNSGHTITHDQVADICIINSCCVTQKSERTIRQLINRASKANPLSKIILAGCATKELQKNPRVLYVSNDYKYLIPDIIDEKISINNLEEKTPSRFTYEIPLRCSTSRVNLKIQDGCDNFCSYCIIPYLRGIVRSKPLEQVRYELRELLNAGYREIILTGVNIGKYNDNGADLAELTSELIKLDGNYRLHMTSIAPDSVSDDLIKLFNSPRLVKHLHLSLQSGSNSILKSMNRSYSREQYLKVIEKIKDEISNFNFTTDVITGFPGETDQDFMDTVEVIKKSSFSHVHTFRFTPRPGTRAEKFVNRVPEVIKKERSSYIKKIYLEQKKDYYSRFDQKESIFLSENTKNDKTRGFNEYYVPININKKLESNKFFRVKTEFESNSYTLTGEIIEES